MHVRRRQGGRRRTAEQIKELLARYHESSATQAEFAKEHGFGLSTLNRWLRRAEEERLPAPSVQAATFIEARLASPPVALARVYRLDLPGGISLRLEGGFDAAELEQLLRVLR